MCSDDKKSASKETPQPGDEPSQLPPRVLYGYARVVRGDTERAAALKADLLSFSRTYGYMLGTVFTDWGVDDTAIARPGFSSLLDVCKLVGSHGVVVPSRSHLSTHDETLAVLLRQIRRTGVELIAADEVLALGLEPTGITKPPTAHGVITEPNTDTATADGDTPC